jgi:hypothetical protein
MMDWLSESFDDWAKIQLLGGIYKGGIGVIVAARNTAFRPLKVLLD